MTKKKRWKRDRKNAFKQYFLQELRGLIAERMAENTR
jgi:hypothetical protein